MDSGVSLLYQFKNTQPSSTGYNTGNNNYPETNSKHYHHNSGMTGFAEDSDYKDNRISQPFITSNILNSP